MPRLSPQVLEGVYVDTASLPKSCQKRSNRGTPCFYWFFGNLAGTLDPHPSCGPSEVVFVTGGPSHRKHRTLGLNIKVCVGGGARSVHKLPKPPVKTGVPLLTVCDNFLVKTVSSWFTLVGQCLIEIRPREGTDVSLVAQMGHVVTGCALPK